MAVDDEIELGTLSKCWVAFESTSSSDESALSDDSFTKSESIPKLEPFFVVVSVIVVVVGHVLHDKEGSKFVNVAWSIGVDAVDNGSNDEEDSFVK